MIERALRETGGNRAEAARQLGIHRQLLYAKLRQHGLEGGPSQETTDPVRSPDSQTRHAAS
jgi:DNA-binding NtrC family response regulator